jgi:hypothetical protein
MGKTVIKPPMTTKTVRNARTGHVVEVKGAGSLKGGLAIKRGIDLTKPIFEQVTKANGGDSRSAERG